MESFGQLSTALPSDVHTLSELQNVFDHVKITLENLQCTFKNGYKILISSENVIEKELAKSCADANGAVLRLSKKIELLFKYLPKVQSEGYKPILQNFKELVNALKEATTTKDCSTYIRDITNRLKQSSENLSKLISTYINK